jgi:hypothetical protein
MLLFLYEVYLIIKICSINDINYILIQKAYFQRFQCLKQKTTSEAGHSLQNSVVNLQ